MTESKWNALMDNMSKQVNCAYCKHESQYHMDGEGGEVYSKCMLSGVKTYGENYWCYCEMFEPWIVEGDVA